MIIFSLFFREFNVLSIENFKIISNLGPLQRMSRMTTHVSKAGKVDPSDTCEICLKTRHNLNPLARVSTLAQGSPSLLVNRPSLKKSSADLSGVGLRSTTAIQDH